MIHWVWILIAVIVCLGFSWNFKYKVKPKDDYRCFLPLEEIVVDFSVFVMTLVLVFLLVLAWALGWI